eukprot:9481537-Pyramimonas_sp.AAC.1
MVQVAQTYITGNTGGKDRDPNGNAAARRARQQFAPRAQESAQAVLRAGLSLSSFVRARASRHCLPCCRYPVSQSEVLESACRENPPPRKNYSPSVAIAAGRIYHRR